MTLWTLPAVAALSRRSRAGAVGWAAAVVGRLVAGSVGGSRPWADALAHPLSVAAAAALTVDAARRGDTVTWRGRSVHAEVG